MQSSVGELHEQRRRALDKFVAHEGSRYTIVLDGLIHLGKAVGKLADVRFGFDGCSALRV